MDCPVWLNLTFQLNETDEGAGDFTAADTIGGQTNAQALAAGDWDGDGDLDLAVANFGAGGVDILENQP